MKNEIALYIFVALFLVIQNNIAYQIVFIVIVVVIVQVVVDVGHDIEGEEDEGHEVETVEAVISVSTRTGITLRKFKHISGVQAISG